MLKHAFLQILCTSLRLVDLNNYFLLCLFLTIKGYKKLLQTIACNRATKDSFKKGIKVKTKTLIHYQSSSSIAERLKKNTFNTLNFSQKGFKSSEEQIGACKSQHQDLNSLSIIKLYGLTVKTEYFQHAKLSVEGVRIPQGVDYSQIRTIVKLKQNLPL